MTRAWKVVLVGALATLVALAPGAVRHKVRHTVRAAGPGAIVGPRLFGFNDNSVLMQQSDATSEIQRNTAVGANVIRYSVNWDYVELNKGEFNWHGYDPLYEAALKNAIRPILVVTFSPSWARPLDLSCGTARRFCRNPPDSGHDADWTNFVRTLVQRYPQAAAVEVWNEPNLTNFWASGPDPVRYAKLDNLAYDAVKQVDPRMPVLGGALSNIQFKYNNSTPFPEYLGAFLDQHPKFDALALHDYAIAGESPTWFDDTLSIARRELDAHGLSATPIWITEFGVSTTGEYAVSEAAQSKQLVGMLAGLGKRRDIKAAVLHTVIPAPSGPSSNEFGYAVMNSDGTPKPAYCALASVRGVARPTGCPGPTRP